MYNVINVQRSVKWNSLMINFLKFSFKNLSVTSIHSS